MVRSQGHYDAPSESRWTEFSVLSKSEIVWLSQEMKRCNTHFSTRHWMQHSPWSTIQIVLGYCIFYHSSKFSKQSKPVILRGLSSWTLAQCSFVLSDNHLKETYNDFTHMHLAHLNSRVNCRVCQVRIHSPLVTPSVLKLTILLGQFGCLCFVFMVLFILWWWNTWVYMAT